MINALIRLQIEIETVRAVGAFNALISTRLRVKNITIYTGRTRIAILAGRARRFAGNTAAARIIFIGALRTQIYACKNV